MVNFAGSKTNNYEKYSMSKASSTNNERNALTFQSARASAMLHVY